MAEKKEPVETGKKTAPAAKGATVKPAAAKSAVAKAAATKAAATKAAATRAAASKTAATKAVATKAAATKAAATKAAATKAAASTAKSATTAKKAEPKKAEPQKTEPAASKATTEKKTESVKAEPTAKAAAAAKAEPAAKATATAKKAEPAAKKAATAKKAEPAAKATSTAKKAEPAAKKAASTEKKTTKAKAKTSAAAKKASATSKATTAKKATATKAADKTAAAKTDAAKKASAATAEAPAAKGEANKAASTKVAEPVKAGETPKATDSAKKEAAPVKVEAVKAVEPEPEPAKAEPVKEEPAKAEPAQEAEPEKAEPEKPEPEPAEPAKPEFADVPGVLIAAAECAPLVKVGGMADVVGALPKYLKKLGVDARVIMPLHRQIKEKYYNDLQHMADFQANLGWRSQYVGVEKLVLDDVTYYFIDNEFYFGGPIYCGGEFEGEQYAFFTRAVMDSIPLLDFDVRILHCNDWHTAMMPLLAKTQYQGGMQAGLRTVLTIHNLHFQGQFSHEFDRDLLGIDDYLATPQFVEHYGCDNMLKAGIVFADKVNTVSPTYAREICEPYLGESLDGVLRSRGGDLWGILNGIDTDIWNPETDQNLPERFSEKNPDNKRKVRDALLGELGLAPAGENTAVISMVGRLTPQKGIDLVQFVLDELMGEDVRVIVLGSGYPEFEENLRAAEGRHKGRLCSYIGYNAELSHRIYAGSDLFLMPSLFEPCGISQMIALRYGTLPIVRETGGLRDTVIPYNEFTGEGNGFSFANYDAGEMLNVIRYALWIWRNEDARKRLIKQAMESDFSFDRCARTYAELYRSLL